jgi:serine/threonine protein kinase
MTAPLAPGDVLQFAVPDRLTVLEAVYRSEETSRALYKVHREADGLPYALKVFPLADGAVAELRRELTALNRQNQHPDKLPRFRGLHIADGEARMLLDWFEGTTLEQVTRGRPAGSREDVQLRVIFLREVCRTVALLHRARFIHRDLKPQNVLARDPRRPLAGVAVIDLGLAAQKRADLEGSHGYRAPEQEGFRAFNLGPPTDVFAIGQIGWFLLTGTTLSLTPADDLTGWMEGSAALSEVLPGVTLPAGLEGELRRATAFRPEQRHPSVDAMRQRLDALPIPSL